MEAHSDPAPARAASERGGGPSIDSLVVKSRRHNRDAYGLKITGSDSSEALLPESQSFMGGGR